MVGNAGLKRNVVVILLGGLAVVLPGLLLLMVLQWLVQLMAELLSPLTDLVSRSAGFDQWLALAVVTVLLLLACFAVGLVVRTRVGRWLHEVAESGLARVVPGYRITRDLVRELLGGREGARLLGGEPALARIHGLESAVKVTAIVTSRHDDGSYTVYVPTAPFPTSGFVYHLPADCVELLPGVSVEAALRTVIACGAGSAEVLGRARIPISAVGAAGRAPGSGPGSGLAPGPAPEGVAGPR